ncbi:hypothetical protein HF086_001718 [Spodoptera exigua]|uniref:Uncharacterized protein n=1 Tax=Spodoptera exigua TaxID=7107 RepID=A0A922MY91_SPOEX|nr:hypothetical protein HF086_001718 [Spodoptera exigua]
MGKSPYIYTESESEDTSISSSENKKKKRFSLLKYTKGSGKKQKCKIQSKSEPDESDYHSKTRGRKVRIYQHHKVQRPAPKERRLQHSAGCPRRGPTK